MNRKNTCVAWYWFPRFEVRVILSVFLLVTLLTDPSYKLFNRFFARNWFHWEELIYTWGVMWLFKRYTIKSYTGRHSSSVLYTSWSSISALCNNSAFFCYVSTTPLPVAYKLNNKSQRVHLCHLQRHKMELNSHQTILYVLQLFLVILDYSRRQIVVYWLLTVM